MCVCFVGRVGPKKLKKSSVWFKEKQGRLQEGPRTSGDSDFGAFFGKKLKYVVDFGTPWNPKGHPKSTFWTSIGAFRSKNAIQEASQNEGRKMDEKIMEKW